jgi:hypothetical protein
MMRLVGVRLGERRRRPHENQTPPLVWFQSLSGTENRPMSATQRHPHQNPCRNHRARDQRRGREVTYEPILRPGLANSLLIWSALN